MNAFGRRYTFKRLAAAVMAVTVSASAFGMSGIKDKTKLSPAVAVASADDDENAAYEKQLKEMLRNSNSWVPSRSITRSAIASC